MSIGARMANLLRANLNALLDRASGSVRFSGGTVPIEELTDQQLEEELRRRRHRREGAERGARNSSYADDMADNGGGSGRFRTTDPRAGYRRSGTGSRAAAGAGSKEARLAKLYAQLECPYGADQTTVRKHYRTMMRKYHPDMHSRDPAKQRIATELSQRLTQAYNELRRILSPK